MLARAMLASYRGAMTTTSTTWVKQIADRTRAVRNDLKLSRRQVPYRIYAIDNADARVSLQALIEAGQTYNVHPLYFLTGRRRRQEFPAGAGNAKFIEAVRRVFRAARLDAAVSTPTVAKRARVPQSTVVRWESGEYERINVLAWDRALSAVGLTWADLFNRALEEVNEHEHDDRGQAALHGANAGDGGGAAPR